MTMTRISCSSETNIIGSAVVNAPNHPQKPLLHQQRQSYSLPDMGSIIVTDGQVAFFQPLELDQYTTCIKHGPQWFHRLFF